MSGAATPEEDGRWPNVILGMTVLDQPGRSVGRHGAQVLDSLAARGYRAGFLAADRAFSSARAEEFQLISLAQGYRPVYDYKIDQLGVQDQVDGFLQIEGDWYCPSIPEPLQEATRDYRNHVIDEDTYRQRLTERWKYAARPKGKPDAEGHLRLQCPAAGSWPMARCPLKPKSLTRDTLGRLHIAVAALYRYGATQVMHPGERDRAAQRRRQVPSRAGVRESRVEVRLQLTAQHQRGHERLYLRSGQRGTRRPRTPTHPWGGSPEPVRRPARCGCQRPEEPTVLGGESGGRLDQAPSTSSAKDLALITHWRPPAATASGSSDPDPPLSA